MGWVDICLLDTGCLAAMVAALSAGITAAKRLYAADLWGGEGFAKWLLTGARKTIGSAAINGAAAAALVVLAVEMGALKPKPAASLSVLTAICLDFATADGRALLGRMTSAILRAFGLKIESDGAGPPAAGPPSPPVA